MSRHIRSLFLLFFIFLSNIEVSNAKTISIKDFGAKGDGKSNDYPAMLAAASYINKHGGGELYFPQGTYFLDSYHQPNKKSNNIVFRNCHNITINAANAIIKLQGDFYRYADYEKGKYKYSKTGAIIPLQFIDCINVKIKGVEIDGGVRQMRKDKDVVESGGHLIYFKDCDGVVMQDINVHHAQSDGIYISGTKSKNFTCKNIRSSNNGRQGMSIIQLFTATFNNCKFINTGITEGRYGSHAPRAGVDIEPRAGGVSVNNIKFINCIFESNLGSQFVCSTPKNTNNILLDKCRLVAGEGRSAYQLWLAAKNVIVQNCYIDCGSGNIYPIANTDPGSSVTIRNCTIKSSGAGIVAVSKLGKDQLTIDSNTIEYTGQTPVKKYFLYLQAESATFTNNKIIIPIQYQRKGAATSLIQKGKIASGNTFYSGSEISKPAVSYQGTKIVKDK